jgi:hypothetical protein
VVHVLLITGHGRFNDEWTGRGLKNWWRSIFFRGRHAATRRKLTTELQVYDSFASIPADNMRAERLAFLNDEETEDKLLLLFKGDMKD